MIKLYKDYSFKYSSRDMILLGSNSTYSCRVKIYSRGLYNKSVKIIFYTSADSNNPSGKSPSMVFKHN